MPTPSSPRSTPPGRGGLLREAVEESTIAIVGPPFALACATLPLSVFMPKVKFSQPSSHFRYLFNEGRVLKLKAKNLKNRLASVLV